MIISKTPFRISFFGGGSDYRSWVQKYGGSVLSTSIDKYCFISCRTLPNFFDHKYRIVYSKIETVNQINLIKHPAVKNILMWKGMDNGLEIHHDGDLPARSGLGSSSSFCVGLINVIEAYKGNLISKNELAKQAIYVEQKIIGENVGSQDQIASAFGGLNKINFNTDGSFEVKKMLLSKELLNVFNANLMLFFSGRTRIASKIAKEQIKNISHNEKQIHEMVNMVDIAVSLLYKSEFDEFGKLLNETWKMKKSLSDKISTQYIDEIYSTGIENGALGGKLLGAGGGGFVLFYAQKKYHANIKKALSKLTFVPFNFENLGSSIVLYEPSGL